MSTKIITDGQLYGSLLTLLRIPLLIVDMFRYSVHNTSGYLAQNLAQSSPNKSTPAPNAPQHPHDRALREGVVKIHEESLPLYPGMPSEV